MTKIKKRIPRFRKIAEIKKVKYWYTNGDTTTTTWDSNNVGITVFRQKEKK